MCRRSGGAEPALRGRAVALKLGSSLVRIHPSPTGVRTAMTSPASASNAARPSAAPIPAHLAKAAGVVGPKTCMYLRASSSRASRGSISGRGTVQITGSRAPSQRIRTVPVGAAYRSALGWTPTPRPASSYLIRRPSRNACKRAAVSSARRRPLASAGSRPSVKTARSRAATTYALNRGPHTWTSDESSQVDGSVPATRAWIERTAARGMLSCRPAHAARSSEDLPGGSRSSSAPALRRCASTCARERSSRGVVT